MNLLTRRQIVAAALALAAGTAVHAQSFPAKPVRVLVGYSPGGAVDIIARSVGQHLQASLGQPIIVDNKPGAGTNIANKALIDSPPDGYTLMLAANALAANVSLFQPAALYARPHHADRAGRARAGGAGGQRAVAGRFDQGADRAVEDQARLDRLTARPAMDRRRTLRSSCSSAQPGSGLSHVPYKGGAQAMNDVIAGHIQTVAVNALEVLPHVKAGKLRVLAVLSEKRSPIFPDVPTIAESGFPGFEASVWYGVVGPAGMPAPW